MKYFIGCKKSRAKQTPLKFIAAAPCARLPLCASSQNQPDQAVHVRNLKEESTRLPASKTLPGNKAIPNTQYYLPSSCWTLFITMATMTATRRANRIKFGVGVLERLAPKFPFEENFVQDLRNDIIIDYRKSRQEIQDSLAFDPGEMFSAMKQFRF
jgi:hypothetical protein